MYDQFFESRDKGLKWPKTFSVRGERIKQTQSTRRLERLMRKQAKMLRRIKKLLAQQAARAANLETHRYVKKLTDRRRIPHQRVRTKDEVAGEAIPDPKTWYRNSLGVVTSVGLWPLSYRASWGMRKTIVDVKPTQLLDPPRSPVTIGSFRTNSLKAAIDIVPAIKSRPIHRQSMAKWPWQGLQNHGILATQPQPITFDMSNANRALQKAIARAYEADIQTNEYLIEWKQVINLLKDPLRTVLNCHRILEKWTRRDAWIWIPQRRHHKAGGTSPGGVLMSMRTRRELDASTVSKSVLNAACNRWLQYRYGIAPLVSDLTTVYGLWLEPIRPPCLKSVSARYWVRRPTKVFSTYEVRRGPFDLTFKRVKTVGEFYAAKVWFDRNEDQIPISYKIGLHPSQWLNILWNSVPYSFVADWVISLDEWMTAQREVPWIQLRGNVVTRKVFENFRSHCISATEKDFGQPCVISGTPIATVHRDSINRKVDLPRTMEPFLSSAWQSVKNAMTASALVLSPILTESLKNPQRKR